MFVYSNMPIPPEQLKYESKPTEIRYDDNPHEPKAFQPVASDPEARSRTAVARNSGLRTVGDDR